MLKGRVIWEQLRSQTIPYVCSDSAALGKIIHLSELPFSSSTGWQKQDNRIYILGWCEDYKVLRWRLSLLALRNSKATSVAGGWWMRGTLKEMRLESDAGLILFHVCWEVIGRWRAGQWHHLIKSQYIREEPLWLLWEQERKQRTVRGSFSDPSQR